MFFAIPGWWQAWPKSAACWSPATPATGTSPPNSVVVPKTEDEDCGWGSRAGSTPSRAQSSSSHASRWMSNSNVREAFV